MTKNRINLYIAEDYLKKIDKLVSSGKFESRSEFIREAIREKLARGEKQVSWRDLDNAALDALAEIIKRARVRKKR